MPYGTQMTELARCAVANHGELKEVVFLGGNKDYNLVFADGTVLTPSDDESLKREYSSYAGYGEIAQQLGGTHPYSLLAFGYQGTGPGCFATFLRTAGFDVTEKDIVDVSPPARLHRDASVASGPAAEETPAVEAPAPAEDAAAPEAPAAVPAAPAAVPADWYPDPSGRHQHRYWDGGSWTDHVADNGQASLDPVAPSPAAVAAQPAAQAGPVEFDENGRVKKITFFQMPLWPRYEQGQSNYMVRSVDTLLEATEVLRKLNNIGALHYYICETPDGKLCRDVNGFYTEAPLKTKELHLATQVTPSPPVESESLTVFGDDVFTTQSLVAALKQNGQYSRLILLMECGRCGYKSPVETDAGPLERECYCCGTINTGDRGNVNVVTSSGIVEI